MVVRTGALIVVGCFYWLPLLHLFEKSTLMCLQKTLKVSTQHAFMFCKAVFPLCFCSLPRLLTRAYFFNPTIESWWDFSAVHCVLGFRFSVWHRRLVILIFSIPSILWIESRQWHVLKCYYYHVIFSTMCAWQKMEEIEYVHLHKSA